VVVVRLFVGYDERSRRLAEAFKRLFEASGGAFGLEIYYVNADSADLKEFADLSHDIFGPLPLAPLHKYSVRALPTIVVGSNKLVEGRLPTPSEMSDIMRRCASSEAIARARALTPELPSPVARPAAEPQPSTAPVPPAQAAIPEPCRACFFFDPRSRLCLRYMRDPRQVAPFCELRRK